MRRRATSLLAGLLLGLGIVGLSACTGGSGPGFDGGSPGKGGACTVQDECFGCGACRLPYDEICLEGSCWLSGAADAEGEPRVASMLLIATFPDLLDRGRVLSAAVRVFDARRSDGARTSCADLLADPVGADTLPELNRIRTLEPRLQIGVTADQSSIGLNAGVGDDRLALIRLHEESGGQGTLLAVGCVENLKIEQGAPCSSETDCTRPRRCEMASQTGRGFCGPTLVEVPLAMP